jgi:hypothetical protein
MRNSENEPDSGKTMPEAYSLSFLALVASVCIGFVCHNFLAGIATWCILVFISMECASIKDKLEELHKKE